MKRRDVLAGSAAALAAALARPALAQGARILKYVPQTDLANPDPIWTTTTIAAVHGFMVWDTLYGIDEGLAGRPQMVAGHDVSSDGLTWTFTLRDGLLFHDGEPVRSGDCIASVQRWGKRNGFGQRLLGQTAEMKALDDKRFQIRLTKPYPLMAFSLGSNCFVMPERIAATDAFTQIKEYVGSGPFRFLRDEWVAGASAAYARNEKYVPRQEPPSRTAGGKVVHFDRVEWSVIPDPATQGGALQRGEVDWVEQPSFDLLPSLRKMPGVTVEVLDDLGVLAVIGLNHTQPPFDNRKLLRAILPAVNQDDYLDAVLGEERSLGQKAGIFTPGSPYANTAGIAAITGKRDVELAKRLVAESGYKGEPIVLMSPADNPHLVQMAQVTDAMFKSLGLNSQYTSMDWGTMTTRRASHAPSSQGGWNAFPTTWAGLTVSNPGSSYPLRGNGIGGWFGWPVDEKMEALREKWFEAPDLAVQKAICEDMQRLAIEDVPFYSCGQWTEPTAYRDSLTGFVKAGVMLFWGVKRV
jgi:peptide/nickel transport system substrate-binding protein